MNVARPREASARTLFLFVFRSALGSIKLSLAMEAAKVEENKGFTSL